MFTMIPMVICRQYKKLFILRVFSNTRFSSKKHQKLFSQEKNEDVLKKIFKNLRVAHSYELFRIYLKNFLNFFLKMIFMIPAPVIHIVVIVYDLYLHSPVKRCFKVFVHKRRVSSFLQQGLHMLWSVMERSPVKSCHSLPKHNQRVTQLTQVLMALTLQQQMEHQMTMEICSLHKLKNTTDLLLSKGEKDSTA